MTSHEVGLENMHYHAIITSFLSDKRTCQQQISFMWLLTNTAIIIHADDTRKLYRIEGTCRP